MPIVRFHGFGQNLAGTVSHLHHLRDSNPKSGAVHWGKAHPHVIEGDNEANECGDPQGGDVHSWMMESEDGKIDRCHHAGGKTCHVGHDA